MAVSSDGATAVIGAEGDELIAEDDENGIIARFDDIATFAHDDASGATTWREYDQDNDQYVVYTVKSIADPSDADPNGDDPAGADTNQAARPIVEQTYPSKEALREDWERYRAPYIPDIDFETSVPNTDSNWTIIIVPDDNNPDWDQPILYERGQMKGLFDAFAVDRADQTILEDNIPNHSTDGSTDDTPTTCPECDGELSTDDALDVPTCDDCGYTPPKTERDAQQDGTQPEGGKPSTDSESVDSAHTTPSDGAESSTEVDQEPGHKEPATASAAADNSPDTATDNNSTSPAEKAKSGALTSSENSDTGFDINEAVEKEWFGNGTDTSDQTEPIEEQSKPADYQTSPSSNGSEQESHTDDTAEQNGDSLSVKDFSLIGSSDTSDAPDSSDESDNSDASDGPDTDTSGTKSPTEETDRREDNNASKGLSEVIKMMDQSDEDSGSDISDTSDSASK